MGVVALNVNNERKRILTIEHPAAPKRGGGIFFFRDKAVFTKYLQPKIEQAFDFRREI
jgi:hypothetical protein